MKWFIYLLECADNTLYTGITKDLEKRIKAHNSSKGGAKYTRYRQPVKLLKYFEIDNKSLALKLEAKIKKLSRKEKLLLTNINELV